MNNTASFKTVVIDEENALGSKTYLVQRFEQYLRPIVSESLRYGLDAKDFLEVAKAVFVDVATSDPTDPDREVSRSKVARETGLTRREVARLRNARHKV